MGGTYDTGKRKTAEVNGNAKNDTKRKTRPSKHYGSGLFIEIRCDGGEKKENLVGKENKTGK